LLVREDNLKIIEEIRNLEKGALGDYIRKKLVPLKDDNAVFYETLYKDILYVLRNVDEPGDNDLVEENGNWPVFDADGKAKLTGYQTRLHEILLSLHSYKAGKIFADKPFNFSEEMRRFEKDTLLNIYTYTPEYKEKLDKINRSIIKERNDNYVLPRLTQRDTKQQPTPEPINIKVKIPAPIIALFCELISKTKIIEKLGYEGVETYCSRVCKKFKLPYTDRVRQNFGGSSNRKNKDKVIQLILPKIDYNTSKILTEYLAQNNK